MFIKSNTLILRIPVKYLAIEIDSTIAECQVRMCRIDKTILFGPRMFSHLIEYKNIFILNFFRR